MADLPLGEPNEFVTVVLLFVCDSHYRFKKEKKSASKQPNMMAVFKTGCHGMVQQIKSSGSDQKKTNQKKLYPNVALISCLCETALLKESWMGPISDMALQAKSKQLGFERLRLP